MKIKRPIVVKGNLAYIQLTKGYTAIIDAADVHIIQSFNWYAKTSKNLIYGCSHIFDDTGKKQKTILLHHLIMNTPTNMHTDHKDCDGLNNRRSNLRIATNNQNQHNQRKHIDNTSGFKGVSWNKDREKWRSRIRINRKEIYLGDFNTPGEAHAAYIKASAELHKEFGRIE